MNWMTSPFLWKTDCSANFDCKHIYLCEAKTLLVDHFMNSRSVKLLCVSVRYTMIQFWTKRKNEGGHAYVIYRTLCLTRHNHEMAVLD
jgi:hypothetical protein